MEPARRPADLSAASTRNLRSLPSQPLTRLRSKACFGSEHENEGRSGTPDRVTSPKTEKSVPATRDASLAARSRQSAPVQHQYNTILVNPKVMRCRSTARFAPQHATF